MTPKYNSSTDKQIIAVDVDEVLAQFIAPCNQYYNQTYHTNFEVRDYNSYSFCDTWGCTDAEAIERVYDFMSSDAMKDLPVVPGAVEGIKRLSRKFRLVVVTSRQSFLKDLTMEWLERHFGASTFEKVLFGNQWLRKDDKSRRFSKAELCESVGAVALIDDLPKYILEVTLTSTCQLGILFNRNNEQKWSVIKPPLPSNCSVAFSWTQVCETLENYSFNLSPSTIDTQLDDSPQQKSTIVLS